MQFPYMDINCSVNVSIYCMTVKSIVYIVGYIVNGRDEIISRLTVVSCEAKKQQQAHALQDYATTTVSTLHMRQL